MKKIPFYKKITKGFAKRSSAENNEHTALEFTWVFIVGLFSLVIMLLLAWNVYLFFKVQKDEALGSPTEEENITTIDLVELNRILETFEERKRLFDTVRERGTGLIDPSI